MDPVTRASLNRRLAGGGARGRVPVTPGRPDWAGGTSLTLGEAQCGQGSSPAAAARPGQAAGAARQHAESTTRRYSTFSLGLEANAGSSV